MPRIEWTGWLGAVLMGQVLATVSLPAPGAELTAAESPKFESPRFESPSVALRGRLFTTPEERQRLDRLRSGHNPAVAVDTPTPPSTRTPETITLDGVILRSRGPSTVWINGRPVAAGDKIGELEVVPERQQGQPQAQLRSPDQRSSFRLKPGQTLEPASGRVLDPLRDPAARRHPSPTPSPTPTPQATSGTSPSPAPKAVTPTTPAAAPAATPSPTGAIPSPHAPPRS